MIFRTLSTEGCTSLKSSFSTARASSMCCSFVVPHSGVTPFICAILKRTCAGVHPFAVLISRRAGWRRRLGEPESVQNDLRAHGHSTALT